MRELPCGCIVYDDESAKFCDEHQKKEVDKIIGLHEEPKKQLPVNQLSEDEWI